MKKPSQPHDKLFKAAFSHLEIVIEYIRNFLPKELVEKLDLSGLVEDSTSYITPKLQSFYSDIVYRCPYGDGQEVILTLLFEHKSYIPTYPHLQLLRYMLEIWEKQEKDKSPLLPIIPIIVYHGDQKWKYRPFIEYITGADPVTSKYIPQFQYLLTDLNNWTDDQLFSMQAGILSNIFILLKHHKDTEYFRNSLSRLLTQLDGFWEDGPIRNLIRKILVYLIETTDIEEEEFIKATLESSEDLKVETMTLYQRLVQKGDTKRLEILVRNAVAEGLDTPLIAKLTDLSIEQVVDLIEKLDLKK